MTATAATTTPTTATAAIVALLAASASTGIAPAPAHAQQSDSVRALPVAERPDTFEIPALVVTATRVPLDRTALPTPVTILTGTDLRSRGIATLAAALREVPGAAVVQGGGTGAQTSLFLRGGESDHVKVLIDGVAVNDPGGAFDFANLSTDQVERIEVVRGPVSVLYGSDAVAGVVHVMTRRGSGAPSVTAEVTGGSGQRPHGGDRYTTYDTRAGLSGSGSNVSYAVGAGRQHSGGIYPFNNQATVNTASARLGWSPIPAGELTFSSRVDDSRSHFPTDGGGALVDENAYLDRRLWTTSLAAGWNFSDRIDGRVQVGLITRDQSAIDEQDGPEDTSGVYASTLEFEGVRRTADARVNVRLPRSVLSAGVAWEGADANTAYTSQSEWGALAASADYDRATTGYYAQLITSPVSRLHLTVGGRLDDSGTYDTFATYRVGAALRVLHGTRLRGALGRGFREPTFAESFGSGFGDAGNAGLEPERSLSREIGIEHDLAAGNATLAATWFDQSFDELIQYTFSPPAEGDPNYFNVGGAQARGLELEARAARGAWSGSASYTWLDTEVTDPGLASDAAFVEGEPLLRRPAHSGSLSGRFSSHAGGVAVTLHTVGEREDVDFATGPPSPRVTLDAYTTVDVAAEYRLPVSGPATDLLVRIDNILDTGYESLAGFPGPGRLIRVGARIATN